MPASEVYSQLTSGLQVLIYVHFCQESKGELATALATKPDTPGAGCFPVHFALDDSIDRLLDHSLSFITLLQPDQLQCSQHHPLGG